jgi:PKD repeat protein
MTHDTSHPPQRSGRVWLKRAGSASAILLVVATCDTALTEPPVGAGPEQPEARIVGSYTGQEGAPIVFDGRGSEGERTLTYAWSFGDGSTGTGARPTHTYEDNGSYSVILIVTAGNVQSAPDTTVATISNVAPTVTLDLDASAVEVGESVAVTGGFTDPGVLDAPWSWELDWGDGTKETGSAAAQSEPIAGSHAYAAAGTYTVRLRVTDKDGGTGTAERPVTVSAPPAPPAPEADAGGPYAGQEGAAIVFDGRGSSGEGTLTYAWSFGDGKTGTGARPTHTYEDNGTYSVILIVTAGNVQSAPDTTVATISNVAPTVTLDLDASAVQVGESVAATGSFTDPGVLDAPWSWELDWGDGTKETGSAAAQSEPIAGSHAYAAAGTYTVRLRVTDRDGGTGTAERPVTVSAPSGPDPDVSYTDFSEYATGQRPHDWSQPYTTSSYRVEASSGAAGGRVLYNSISTTAYHALRWDAVGTPVDVEIEALIRVGPGSAYNESMALVVRGSGSETFYSSRLDSGSGLWTLARYNGGVSSALAVTSNPFPAGTWVRHRLRVEGGTLRVKLWAAGSPEPASWTLEATDPSPLGAGFVGVWMRRGPAINEVDWVRVTTLSWGSGNQSPSADFGFTTDQMEATFTDRSTDADGTIVSWAWSFGDGTVATNRTPIHTYPVPGTYTATLTVTDNEGATHSRQRSVSVSGVGVSRTMLIGAGDIAGCGVDRTGHPYQDEATAAILDRFPAATVFTAGDNVYPDGTAAEFEACYHPTWGRHKDRTRPTPGNHEYYTPNAQGYYNYFGAAAGDPGRGYYHYMLGGWLIIALNTEAPVAAGSQQEQWLRATLAANPTQCTLAYFHHPRFSSSRGDNAHKNVTALWQALYDYGADLVISAHDHLYERFAPRAPNGALDLTNGIRQITAGMGGARLYGIGTVSPHSEAIDNVTHGVVKLVLEADAYTWEFIPVAGKSFTDSGRQACH